MRLAAPERRALEPLLADAVQRLPAGAFSGRLSALQSSLAGDGLSPQDEETLAVFIETLAHSRRLAAEGAGAERRLGSVYRRTERGREAAAGIQEAGQLLEGLAGQRLEQVSLSLVAPGTYLLHLATEGLDLRIELGPRGISAAAAVGE